MINDSLLKLFVWFRFFVKLISVIFASKSEEMKIKNFILSGLAMITLSMNAQELPKVSPNNNVEQVIGLTHVKIKYSRPSVKGRVIFGELVPYNEVWRLGANEPTTITTDQVLTFGKQDLKPGTYAVFAIPGEKEWTVVFNTDSEQWGAGSYDEAKNIVSLKVPVEKVTNVETLTILFSNLKEDSGELTIEWSNVKVNVPFKTDTKSIAEANIEAAIEKGEDLYKVYYYAASYYRDQKDLKKAMNLIDNSIKQKDYYGNNFMKARILADMDKKQEAVEYGTKAAKQAKEEEKEGWVEYINKNVAEWSK
ncbi:MAG: tetratricopeptide (TPR) repeat protein [Glaciecola sp.]